MIDEQVLPIVSQLRLITAPRSVVYCAKTREQAPIEWRTRVYDGSYGVHEVFGSTRNETLNKAAKWCFDNYTVPKTIQEFTWDEVEDVRRRKSE